jgi:hypothetical protein
MNECNRGGEFLKNDILDLVLETNKGSGVSSNAGVQNHPKSSHHRLLVQPRAHLCPEMIHIE